MTAGPTKRIFLSHAGEDADLARQISRRLETSLGIEVFNTSEPQHRFKDRPILAIFSWRAQLAENDQKLRQFLETHMRESLASLLLATPAACRKHKRWIVFETELADRLTKETGIFFCPIVTEPEAYARLWRSHQKAAYYNGANVSDPAEFERLISALQERAFG